MENKTTTAISGTQHKKSILSIARSWANTECKWVTRMTRTVEPEAETITNGEALALSNLGVSVPLLALFADMENWVTFVLFVWVLVSALFCEKGGLK